MAPSVLAAINAYNKSDAATAFKLLKAAHLGHGSAQQVVCQAGHSMALPPSVNTELAMRIALKNTLPGKTRYCGFLV